MKKSDYIRGTGSCRFDELRTESVNAIRDFFTTGEHGSMEDTVLHCFQTTGEKKGFFGKTGYQYTEMVITTEFLLWGLSGDGVRASSVFRDELRKAVDEPGK